MGEFASTPVFAAAVSLRRRCGRDPDAAQVCALDRPLHAARCLRLFQKGTDRREPIGSAFRHRDGHWHGQKVVVERAIAVKSSCEGCKRVAIRGEGIHLPRAQQLERRGFGLAADQ